MLLDGLIQRLEKSEFDISAIVKKPVKTVN